MIECNHEAEDNKIQLTSNPPRFKCKHCGLFFTTTQFRQYSICGPKTVVKLGKKDYVVPEDIAHNQIAMLFYLMNELQKQIDELCEGANQ